MRAFVYDRASNEAAAIHAASMLTQLPEVQAGPPSNIWPEGQRSSIL